MPIFKSLPIIKIINGKEIKTSEAVVVIDTTYKTNGESVVVVKEVDECNLFLDSNTTDHVVVKALTNVVVSANETIDEEYNEIGIFSNFLRIEIFACVICIISAIFLLS